MPIFDYKLPLGLLAALLCFPAAGAQQGTAPGSQPAQGAKPNQNQPPDQSTAPIPAYHSPLASAADQSADADQTQQLTPDDHAVTGAQTLSLGSPETSRSYWQPHIDVSAYGQSNALGANSSGTNWTVFSSLLGGIDLHKVSGSSDLTLGYVAGGLISTDSAIGTSPIQELNVTEKLTVRRLTLSFLDSMTYLPEAAFGFGGVGGLSLPGVGSFGVGGLQPGLTPGGSILTTRDNNIANSFLTEADTRITPRSSITLVGGYSLLHYFDDSLNLLDYSDTIAQVGYNHTISREDSVGVLYRFSAFRYSSNAQTIDDNVVQITYAKRLTGRLSFQVSAGPEYTLFGTPVATVGATTTSSSMLGWSLASSLTYQVKSGSLAAAYSHGVSGGSGVFAGSVGDSLTGLYSRQLSRTLNGGISGGYSRNRGLVVPGFGIANQAYDYWFGGAHISHPWGRSLNLFASYQAQYQTSNASFCAGATCGTNFLVHIISAGFSWRPRPMLF